MRSRFLGELSCILQGYASHSNQGKTTLLLNDAVDLAKQGYKVAFISLEIGSANILRFLGNIAGDESNGILSRISVHEVSIGENSLDDIEQIIAKASADVAIIDYLGLIYKRSDPVLSAHDNMLVVSSRIKSVAITTDTRIITAMQLSRNYSSNTSTSPESAVIEYLNMRTLFNKSGKLTINGKTKWIIGEGRTIIRANPVIRFFDDLWVRLVSRR